VRARRTLHVALCAQALNLLVTLQASAQPESVWVFTTATLPTLRQLDLSTQVFTLDAIEKPLRHLSFPYPGSEDAARNQAVLMINSRQGQAVLEQLRRNAQALALAWQSGIDKLPAVLVDQTYVVYGEYDVQIALDRVALFREEKLREERDREQTVRAERVRKAVATEMSARYAQ
jgi:integrating conjugative element protein (TIGR03757 family)